MDSTDSRPFFEALNTMGELFSDALSELRQRTYWELCRDKITIEEWRYACTQAMARETFHKVPLPAQLMDYVREYRREQRQRLEQEEQRQFQVAYNLREAERLALEASPAWKAEQQKLCEEQAQREARKHEKEVQDYAECEAWKASLSKQDLKLFELLNPPFETYIWRGVAVAEEQLHYKPHGDPAEAKRKARAQLAQLMAQESPTRSPEEC